MTNCLTVNSIIQWEPQETGLKPIIERILWIEPADNFLIVINVNKADAMPKSKNLTDIISLVEDGSIKILQYYKKELLILPENDIPNKWIERRNKAWDIISDLVQNEPDIYFENLRGPLITKVLLIHKTTKPSVYSYLKKYWQGGKVKNCLLPYYFKCGGPDKEKFSGGQKRGRTRINDLNSNKLNLGNQINNQDNIAQKKTGINVNKKIRRDFLRAVRDFYKTTDKYPLNKTYEKMIFRDYAIGYEEVNGIEIPILKPPEELPTLGQFKYWVKKETDIQDIIQSREGDKRYNLSHRPILGKSTHQAYGPGSRYQIDATSASVYLINSLTRNKIVKRATIYVIIDVFSRMITGLYIGLENPSWLGACMALANAGTEKVGYCKNYGINITIDDWPCMHLPDLLTADRGELEGDKPNHLINTVGVDTEILPSYRADWKGIVESEFRKLDLGVVFWLPGSIKKRFRERGEKDYRLGAALTLQEFTKIIINCILFYNNIHRMNSYDKNEFQIAEKVKPIPINLWNWGIQKTSGRLRQIPEDILKLNLMPSANATVTHKGIRLGRSHYYSCSLAETEHWYQQARAGHNWQVPVSYDPRNMDFIYIRLKEGKDYEKCYLLESSFAFKDKYYEEVDEYIQDEKKDERAYEYTELQGKANLNAKNQSTISNAINETAQAASDTSDREKVNGIRDNSAKEKADNQIKEAFNLSDSTINTNTHNIPNHDSGSDDDYEYVPARRYI